jgi:hypothetical protein
MMSSVGKFLIGTYMWMPIDAGGNVDDGVAVEHHLLGWPGDAGERQSGVPHHAVAKRSCGLR